MNKTFDIIAATCLTTNLYSLNRGIGYKNKLPWKNQDDMNFFKKLTSNTSDTNILIMGRKTWESMNKKNLCKKRQNIVISSNHNLLNKQYKSTIFVKSLDDALELCNLHDGFFNSESYSNLMKTSSISLCNNLNKYFDSYSDNLKKLKNKKINNTFVIGGESIYREAINHKQCKNIYLTKIDEIYKCDTYFPLIANNYKLTDKKLLNFYTKVYKYTNKYDYNSDEYQYLNLLQKVLNKGEKKKGRNGYTYSLFPNLLEFDLQKGFPLLTTKKMFWEAIVEELLFFLRGDTDTRKLEKLKINIWKGNTNKEFLKSVNLDYPEGYMGPMYGWQWNYFGGEYNQKDFNLLNNNNELINHCQLNEYNQLIYNKKINSSGYSQLIYLIKNITDDPNSRRHIITTYNPIDALKSVLYPCHGLLTQFYVREGKYLDCSTVQRSGDLFLGVPYNISSYAILMHLLSIVTGYEPGKLSMLINDCHIYNTHKKAVNKQLIRIPYDFPQLKVNNLKRNNNFIGTNYAEHALNNIKNLQFNNFKLSNYDHYPIIKARMVA